MLAKALSCAVVGLDSALVGVEVGLSIGLKSFQIVETEHRALFSSHSQMPRIDEKSRLGKKRRSLAALG